MIRDGVELKWKKDVFPLDCFYLQEVPENYVAAYEDVRIKFESEFNLSLFSKCIPWRIKKLPTKPPPQTILLRIHNEEFKDFYGGMTSVRYWEDGIIISAEIFIDIGFEGKMLEKLMFHEMGHALGLEHDNTVYSIMNQKFTDYTNEITFQDVMTLQEEYSK
jgi:hypothetical protein